MRRWYDSLGTTIKETVALKNVAATTETRCEHDGLGNVTRRFYPGGRVLLYSYDELNRLVAIHEEESGIAGRELVRYSYVGGRVARADMGNCTRTDVLYDGATGDLPAAGDFGVGRVARIVHSRTDTSGAGPGEILDDRRSTWDRAGNRTSIHVVSSEGPEDGVLRTFGYDSAYRMISSEGGLFGNVGYDIDGVGNRSEVTGGESPGEYSMDEDDAPTNQYTTAPRPVGGPGGLVIGGGGDTVEAAQSYDLNGNLNAVAGSGGAAVNAAMGYDWRNRMIRYADSVAGVEARYQYDPFGRRVFREVTTTPASGSPTTSVVRYVYACDGWTVLEERRGSTGTGTRTSHVHGLRIDEAIMSLVETGAQAGRERWYLHDDLMSVHLVLDENAQVVGFEVYGDYGAGVSFDAPGAPMAASAQRQFPRFTGREQDIETGFVYLRNRYMDPVQGRFTTRDPIGTWGDDRALGASASYTGTSPITLVDPMGLEACPAHCGLYAHPQVMSLMDAVSRAYRSWDYIKKTRQCTLLVGPSASNAWDIDQMTDMPTHNPHPCGSKPCDGGPWTSVEMLTGCHPADGVNYIVFGVMARLCNFSRIKFELALAVGAGPHKPNGDSKWAWAQNGYSAYYLANHFPRPPKKLQQCTPCPPDICAKNPNPLPPIFSARWGSERIFTE